ncbi:MAG: HAD family hydrolase [Firmicutes bacterium]|nr:HAD family hydrolase [Bacillota bacterium]
MNHLPQRSYDLILFDFDGTLYDSEEHFDRYLGYVSDRIPDQRDALLADYQAVLSGTSTLKVGSHVSTDYGSFYIGDYWWIIQALGVQHGAKPEDLEASFLQTRTYMMNHPHETRLIAGLAPWLKETAATGRPICCLATNSPEQDSSVILQALGVRDFFADITYAAQKPKNTQAILARLCEQFSVKPDRILSIGDHYFNDVEPAQQFGADGLFINRHHVSHPRDCTYEVDRSEQLIAFLQALTAPAQD